MGTHVRTLCYFRSFSPFYFAKRKNIVTFALERQKEVLSVADAHKDFSEGCTSLEKGCQALH